MPSHFCLSFRFLDRAFHGRRDGGLPEWPPSPLRTFQALVCSAAARGRREGLSPHARSALKWLEQQAAPTMVVPAGVTVSGYRLSVPNNAMDIVANAWCRGNDSNVGDANPATHRTMKPVRPTLLIDGEAIHYLWALGDPLTDEVRGYIDSLCGFARSVVAVGWGIDLVVGHGAVVSEDEASALPGERWLAGDEAAGDGLRVPRRGTLEDLIHRHERFLARLDPDGVFTAPPPLSAYTTIEYRRATDPPRRQVAAFSLLKLDASGFRAFDTARRGLTVAGMLRHAAKLAAGNAGWSESKTDAFILGHGESKDDGQHVALGPQRFAYLPLPSIEARGEGRARVVGSIRRVIMFSFAEHSEAEIAWARRALSGHELIDEATKQPVALLSLIPDTDRVARRYIERASSWATVTPVVLPGYDDPDHYRRRVRKGVGAEEQKRLLQRLDHRIAGLLRKAIIQAGFSEELARHAELEWRSTGFWPGTDLASRYRVPEHLRRFPRVHVRLHWRDPGGRPVPVPGPVCLGGGRFYGVGLLVGL